MNRPRKQPVLDPETAAAFAYQERHMQSNIVAIDRDGFAKPAAPRDLERAGCGEARWLQHAPEVVCAEERSVAEVWTQPTSTSRML